MFCLRLISSDNHSDIVTAGTTEQIAMRPAAIRTGIAG
jgi:hypothetical protein